MHSVLNMHAVINSIGLFASVFSRRFWEKKMMSHFWSETANNKWTLIHRSRGEENTTSALFDDDSWGNVNLQNCQSYKTKKFHDFEKNIAELFSKF